jgi:putative acetyltransferase
MMVRIEQALAPNGDVRMLVGELEAELAPLNPPEQRHGLSLEAIFQPHIFFFVAYRYHEPLGCGGIALLPGFAEVKRMYVRPAERGRGVANAIMERLIEETRAAGRDCLRLETGASFAAANRFYRRWGFAPCAAFEPYASMPPHTIAASAFLERRLA